MTKIKSIQLINFCGYKNTTFEFCNKDGSIKNIALIYGNNGSGKSNLLNAINLAGSASQYQNREIKDIKNMFRTMTYHPDYDPSSTAYSQEKGFEVPNKMEIKAIYATDKGDKKVEINNIDGVVINELERRSNGYTYFIDADHPNEASKFQFVDGPFTETFIEMAKIVYGFNCYFDTGINGSKIIEDNGFKFYTDFVIEKYGDKIHFKRMSDGENKIAKLLEALCDDEKMNYYDIIQIDSFEKEIYFKRHAKFIDKMLSVFPDKQFIIVTHSGTLIEHVLNKYGENYLYDLEQYKIKELGLNVEKLIS